jgi:hypothetical protein
MEPSKADRERLIFELFAKSKGMFVDGAIIESRKEPEPDILFSSPNISPISYELVELIDRDLSHTLQRQLDSKRICYSVLENMDEPNRIIFKNKFANADIFIAFKNNLTFKRRQNALPQIFDVLIRLEDGVTGRVLVNDIVLKSVIDYVIISRGKFVGPMFDVPTDVAISDPTVELIDTKLLKIYKTPYEVSLLAYLETNLFSDDLSLPALDSYFAELDSECKFASIFIFDCQTRQIKKAWHRES